MSKRTLKNFVRNVSSGMWMMEPKAALSYLPLVHSILTGDNRFKMFDDEEGSITIDPSQESQNLVRYAIVGNAHTGLMSAEEIASAGIDSGALRVAVIPYKEPVQKYGDWCSLGTEWLASTIANEANNPSVSAIVIDIDSPGGSADAVNSPSAAILEARKKKPVIGYAGNGMVASAAYWIMSHCEEIYASYESDTIGSIGTYITLVNYEKFLAGWYQSDVHQVYATRSTEKNKGYRDITSDESSSKWLVEKELDPFNDVFIQTVKNNRPDISQEVFKGRLYLAKDAEELGLIDGFKTLDQTIAHAQELSRTHNTESINMFGNKYPKLTKLVSAIAENRTEEDFQAASQEIASSGLVIISAQDLEGISALESRIEELQQALTAAQNANQVLQGELDGLNATIATSLNLEVSEQGFVNSEGEIVTIESAVQSAATELTELRSKSSGLNISKSERVEEGPEETPELGEQAVRKMYAAIDEKINNY